MGCVLDKFPNRRCLHLLLYFLLGTCFLLATSRLFPAQWLLTSSTKHWEWWGSQTNRAFWYLLTYLFDDACLHISVQTTRRQDCFGQVVIHCMRCHPSHRKLIPIVLVRSVGRSHSSARNHPYLCARCTPPMFLSLSCSQFSWEISHLRKFRRQKGVFPLAMFYFLATQTFFDRWSSKTPQVETDEKTTNT